MVRSMCGVVVLLTAGLAQSSPPTEMTLPPPTLDAYDAKRIRFLSLAEARALALEQSNPSLGMLITSQQLADKHEREHKDPVLAVWSHSTPEGQGILLTGIHPLPPHPETERNVNQMLLNVEGAYWNLYGSYWQLYSREQALRMAYDAWKIVAAKHKAGRVSLADLAQAQGQYELFRSQRLQALDTVMDNERQLRALMGIKIKDGYRLVPSDAPTLVEKHPDWNDALRQAKNRPELRIARADITAAQCSLILIHRIMATAVGLFVPQKDFDALGLREAELRLDRARLVLRDQELKAERFLGLYQRRMATSLAQIKAARAQRDAFATQLRVRYEKYKSGAQDATLDLLLEAQRFWADAVSTEYQAIASYNLSLAGWEYGKGTILTHAKVSLAEEPPAGGANVRASAIEHQRTREQVQQARYESPSCPLHTTMTVSLPALWQTIPPLRDAEALPPIQGSAAQKQAIVPVIFTEWKKSAIFPREKPTH